MYTQNLKIRSAGQGALKQGVLVLLFNLEDPVY
jgi:hypothetical protein